MITNSLFLPLSFLLCPLPLAMRVVNTALALFACKFHEDSSGFAYFGSQQVRDATVFHDPIWSSWASPFGIQGDVGSYWRVWRDGSSVKNICYSSKGQKFSSQHLQPTICNSSWRGCNALFWPLWPPGSHGTQIHSYQVKQTKINLLICHIIHKVLHSVTNNR